MTRREITISGNWRVGGPSNEFAGGGLVDSFGAVECSADLGGNAYDQIQDQICDGQIEGEVTIEAEDGREITYSWLMTSSLGVEVRRHNGQSAYGNWEPIAKQDVWQPELVEAIAAEQDDEDSGKVMVGGQSYLYR